MAKSSSYHIDTVNGAIQCSRKDLRIMFATKLFLPPNLGSAIVDNWLNLFNYDQSLSNSNIDIIPSLKTKVKQIYLLPTHCFSPF